jgi:hypothetical protein
MPGESARLVKLGTIDGGATPILADVTTLGSAVAITLSTDYELIDPDSPPFQGYPQRPSFTGSATPEYPHTIPSGTTFTVLQCEATALIAAGAATLA